MIDQSEDKFKTMSGHRSIKQHEGRLKGRDKRKFLVEPIILRETMKLPWRNNRGRMRDMG